MRHRGRIRLGVLLAALTATATAVVVGAAFTLLNLRVNAATRSLIAGQVTQGQRTLAALRRNGDRQFLAAAALLAGNPNLRSAMATARVERDAAGADRAQLTMTVERELERLAPDLQRDLIVATDERGRVFAAQEAAGRTGDATRALRPATDLSAVPAISNALDESLDGGSDARYRSALRLGDAWYFVAAAPIVIDGFTIGTAVLGDRLDTAYLRAVQESFGGELAISAGDSIVASTVRAGAIAPGVLGTDAGIAGSEEVDGIEYMAAALPIGDAGTGATVRLHLLQPVTPALRRATRTLLTEFVLWGVIAVLTAAVGTALVARRVLDPLDRFVAHLRSGAGGAGAVSFGRAAPGAIEIRWLHVAFARLMGSLARKRSELEHQAWHDPLTGLANRVRFHVAAADALSAPGAGDVAVLFIDLDHFKTVNDALGHAVGDELLIEVARRLERAVPASGLVARLGGDEFAILLHGGVAAREANGVAEGVLRMLRETVALERAAVLVGASIGVAHATVGDTADDLLRNADVAMYRAKQQGRGRFERFAPEMHAAVLARLELESDLRLALLDADTHLRLVYQPIVALEFERITGVEALVRWMHPTRGLVSPAEFIPLAEATGLVIPLGRWVLRSACMQAAAWQRADAASAAGFTDAPYVSVNLSGRQLEDEGLVDEVRAVLAESGLEPARLLLEITESVLVQRADASLRALRALKTLGVRLAIDDFGTGYSSLAYLQRFPVDVLKIDKAFVDRVATDAADTALARGIFGLAASLGLRCIAEGIESEDQVTQLRALGCGYGQGYYFARPLTADRATSLLAARSGYRVLAGYGAPEPAA